MRPPKIIITKKDAWKIVLKAKDISKLKSNQKTYQIRVNIRNKCISSTYSCDSKKLINMNFECESKLLSRINMYLNIIFHQKFNPYFIGHLAQSIDGFIATKKGESKFISTKENLEHVHLLRCISDVIIVGHQTVVKDNPQLTARIVNGENPMRLVIDKDNKLNNKFRVFNNIDNLGFKIISSKYNTKNHNIFTLPLTKGRFSGKDLELLLKKLNKRIVFIEGGGSLISSFFKDNIFNRLQICICPILMGGGKNSFLKTTSKSIDEMNYERIEYYQMGNDVLCDIELSSRCE